MSENTRAKALLLSFFAWDICETFSGNLTTEEIYCLNINHFSYILNSSILY